MALIPLVITSSTAFPLDAIWRNQDSDQPVTVTRDLGERAGRHYLKIKGSRTGVPVDELFVEVQEIDPDMDVPEKFMPPHQIQIEIPQHPDVERSILGSIIKTESIDLLRQAQKQLIPGHFYLQSHQIIFQVLIDLLGQNSSINLILVIEELKRRKHLTKIGGPAYVSGLIDGVPFKSDLSREIRLLRDAAQRRHFLHMGQRIIKRSIGGQESGEDILYGLRDEIRTLSDTIELDDDIVPLSDIEAQPIDWLWYPRIPLNSVSMIQGEEGIGKSFMLSQLGAAITRAKGLPDLRLEEPAKILWLAAEDDHARTLRPRLEAAGADCSMILIKKRIFKLNAKGLLNFRDAVMRYRPKVVIFDPIISYCDGDPNKAEVTRATTNVLGEIAVESGCAIILLRHIGKAKGGGDPRAAGLYSIEWRAAVRSELLIGADPDDKSIRAITHTKNNGGPLAESIGYEIRSDITSPCGARFYWTGQSELTSERILQKIAEDDDERVYRKQQKVEAVDFLKDLLSNGPIPQKNIEAEAKAAGVSYRTLERIKHSLEVKAFSKGNGERKVWFWQMNGTHGGSGTQPRLTFQEGENGSEGRQLENGGGLREVESPDGITLWKTPKAATPQSKWGSEDPMHISEVGGLRKKEGFTPLESNTPKTANPIISGGLRNSGSELNPIESNTPKAATNNPVAVFEKRKKRSSKGQIPASHCAGCGAKLDDAGRCDFCSSE